MNQASRKDRGITLLELMIVLAIIAIAATIAAPSVQDLLRTNRVAAQNNELVALISLTKNQAIRQNETWLVEFISTGFSWTGNVRPADRTPEADEDEGCPERSGVVRCSSFQNVQLEPTGAKTTLEFNNRGYLVRPSGQFGSEGLALQHRDCRGNRQRRQIEILATGQISSEGELPCVNN